MKIYLCILTFLLTFQAMAEDSLELQRPDNINDNKWSSLKTAVQEVKLLPSAGGGIEHRFGSSISVDGNRMVVGAPNYSLNTIIHGAVYVFDFDGTKWNESEILTPFDGNNDDQFGVAVSLSGNRLLIGANKDDDSDTDAGVVFVYDYNGVNWQFTQKLISDDAAPGYKFGGSLSLSGNRALIGSDKAGESINSTTGAAYIFDFNNNLWSQTARLLASDADDADNFGISVSLFGDRALIGNSNNDDAGNGSGSAYVFDFDGTDWLEIQKLTANNAGFNHRFGSSVSLSSNRILIGASGEKSSGDNTGAAYVFNHINNTWTQTQKLNATDAQANAKFGNSVNLIGNRALITAVTDTNKGAAYVFDFNGNTWDQSQKLTASDATAQDQFGFAASLTSDRFAIGAHLDDSNGDNSGSVYVFDNDGNQWMQTQKILAVKGMARLNTSFGYSVSLFDNRALVGVRFDSENGSGTGAVYVFDFDGSSWIQTQKFTASDIQVNDEFGYSVSLSSNRALIGAPDNTSIASHSGSAYVYDYNGVSWDLTQKLVAIFDGESDDRFGSSVSISGDKALIGAPSNSSIAINSGSVYFFYFDNISWNLLEKKSAMDGQDDDEFGISVSISGDRALVGAIGSAYIFDMNENTWNQSKKLTASDALGGLFGTSVSLDENRALVGAKSHNGVSGTNSGAAYIYDYDGISWSETEKISPSDGQSGDQFGVSVSLSGNRVLIGAQGDDDSGDSSGAAYIYYFDGKSWNQTPKITAADGDTFGFFGNSVSSFGNQILIGAYQDSDRGNFAGSAYIFIDNNSLIFENGFEN